MKSALKTAFCLILFQTMLAANPSVDSLFLRVAIPEQDTTELSASRIRIGACAPPNARAFINYKETKVYPSGAFVGLENLIFGKNVIRLTVVSTTGDSLVHELVVNRSLPLMAPLKFPISIEEKTIEPARDIWLGKNGALTVRFLGSPGYEAVFDIDGVETGIPMKELPASETGVEGIYVGRYIVKETDVARDVPIRIRLNPTFWGSTKAYSKGKVSILPLELPRIGEIVGRKPFMNSGLGTDRLGGYKLGFLQPGVRVIIDGKEQEQYRIRLTDEFTAWIPQEFIKLLPGETSVPLASFGNITIIGNEKEDVVSINLGQRLPYISDQATEPNRLTVDIFGAAANSITQYLSAKGIENVSWNQIAQTQFRLTIVLKHPHWGYDISYDNSNMLRVRIRRSPVVDEKAPLKDISIAIDAGHGGLDSKGALGATGALEKDINLDIAKRIEELLKEAGAAVFLTRGADTAVEMNNRIERIISSGCKLLVIIHCNSAGISSDPLKIRGTGAYYRYAGFHSIAQILYGKMLQLGLDESGITGNFNFALNSINQLPNTLIEVAFLSNPEEEMRLIDPLFRQSIAVKIVEGIQEFVLKNAAFKRAP